MYPTFLVSSAPIVGILAPNMPPRTAMPWSGLSLITCSVPSLLSRKSLTAERCKSVAQQDFTGKCVLPAASLADMTESETKTGVESDSNKSHGRPPALTEIPAVELVDEGVRHRREPPQHAERVGDVSVLS